MKKVFITLIGLIFMLNIQAQTKASLIGHWHVARNLDKDQMVLRKYNSLTEEYVMGRFFKFNKDGTYNEYAQERCGLDDNHYSYTGKWSYNPKTKIIELSEINAQSERPNIYKNYKLLDAGSIKVVSFKNGELIIQIMKPWEEVTEKTK